VTRLGQRKPIGEALVEEGAISKEQLTHALAEQKKTGTLLGESLISQGILTSAAPRPC
jgi:mannitol/fructose-specific phosphotransferase system IIA component